MTAGPVTGNDHRDAVVGMADDEVGATIQEMEVAFQGVDRRIERRDPVFKHLSGRSL
ncbi:hypothetical protein D3C86_2121080 [compost metagenome]